jgi:hypothetical protein
MIQNAQLRTAHAKGRPARSDPSDIGPELERRWFEFDRNAVLRQIEMAQGALDENANELEMVAVEGVFEKSLSDELSRTSRSLYAISQELGVPVSPGAYRHRVDDDGALSAPPLRL